MCIYPGAGILVGYDLRPRVSPSGELYASICVRDNLVYAGILSII